MSPVNWSKCYVCERTDSLWLTYPYLGNVRQGVLLCPEHYEMYTKRHNEFQAMVKEKGHK